MLASVDYQLIGHWEASQRRQQTARQALPSAWRKDPGADPAKHKEHPSVVGSSAVARFLWHDR